MYDIIPPNDTPDPFRYNYRKKKDVLADSASSKGKWQRKPSGRHFDIIAKNKEKAKNTFSSVGVFGNMPIAERDVDYRFPQSSGTANLKESAPSLTRASLNRGVSLPSRSSVMKSPSLSRISMPNISHRTPGLIILLIGFTFLSFAIWNLQAAGRGMQVLASVESRVKNAIADMTKAGSALADTGSDASKLSFASAGVEFVTAQHEMDSALASNKNILSVLDVTGSIKSGSTLLSAGIKISSAGEHIANAVQMIGKTNTGTSLTDAMKLAQPELANAEQDISSANDQLAGVSTGMLPKQVADQVITLKTVLPKLLAVIHHLNSESGTLLTLLGADRDRQYLIMFANNDELRPVGGFIGSTAVVNVSKGKVENIDVQSVYDRDGQLKTVIAPPEPLTPITDRWYLRDSNWFVDYKKDAQKASDFLEQENGPTVDGVILFTPDVIKNLLSVTGPIHVPGYDVDVTADNFVTVTQGEVTYNYDHLVNKPKQFLADLTPILLSKLFASADDTAKPADRLATLTAITNSLSDKDILLYFKNESAQQEVENLGWSGVIPQDTQGFLMIDNANIGGHKSDQFVSQEIDTRNTVLANGDVDVVTTIRRTHHGPDEKIDYPYPAGEDPSQKDNVIYQRVLVPKNAVLLDAQGFTQEKDVPHPLVPDTTLQLTADADIAYWQQQQHGGINGTTIGSESGYAYFANWLVTKPGQTSVALYHYRIPHGVVMPSLLHPATSYSVALVKQPGQQRTTISASIAFPKGFRIVDHAPDSGVTLDSDSSIVYRGDEARDTLVGAVVEK
ncbi:MAG: DUF4012 domain-containing protein [Candidatus Andersenbacteria bacterium]|nr:DUF4012 domain-containing protein [Candidatus Andersenbacteria bacterium]